MLSSNTLTFNIQHFMNYNSNMSPTCVYAYFNDNHVYDNAYETNLPKIMTVHKIMIKLIIGFQYQIT